MKQINDSKSDALQDERRDQIKRAALKVFAKRGIDGTKMSTIAAEAGISQGLSYRYFSSKEEIFTVLVQEAIEEAQIAIRNAGHLPGTPKEQLRLFTQRLLDESHKHYFLLLQHALTSEEVPVQAKQLMEQYSPNETIDQLVPIFIKGQQMGEFCEGDPHKLLFIYFSVITGLMLQESLTPHDYWIQEVDILMRILMKQGSA
ncbi:TetR/AcrR family transcriptional regulator [Paenibacillus durus]|uniref:TetR family transcriptional regulator n=1 Tax=Paenibacillus durus ATCC 35681 TaxID=1333534 RepID=A0A0F7CHW8_PAEDU|nr:TetR/AcrR family transcriptional regulator [Paenibacillus durus]AKG34110.1 TetR family transcriptional regulator [Paenibacillus durus ATCC 35681]